MTTGIPSKTLAMVQTAPRKLEAQELPIPEIGDDDALLRIEACGICGSDYEQYEGVIRAPMPAVPGHEPLGIIEAIGDRAARRWNAPAYRLKAWRLLHDIRTQLVRETPTGPVLLPGTSGFIHDGVMTVNLSYWVFPALSEFDRLQPYGPWADLKVSGLKLLGRARFGVTQLPADWMLLTNPLAPSPLFPARFGFEALRIVLYACWDGLCHHPALGRLEKFWLSNENPPAWVNLEDGSHAPVRMRPGAMAVRELLLKTGGAVKVPAQPTLSDKDYYDSTLRLLASLAAHEQS